MSRESCWRDELILNATTPKFESAILEQLDAAHNLARWLMRNDQDAQDVVQESCMKAFRAFDSFRGGDFRAWFLAIVRNTSFTWLARNKNRQGTEGEQSLEVGAEIAADNQVYDPQAIAMRAADADWVRRAIDQLPAVLREAVVLREMEGLSYKEIGKIAGVPIGTVMSRLARGRTQLQALLMSMNQPESNPSSGGQPR
jgi:RNA polymerase sigma-70 factor (ECF subfamily)